MSTHTSKAQQPTSRRRVLIGSAGLAAAGIAGATISKAAPKPLPETSASTTPTRPSPSGM